MKKEDTHWYTLKMWFKKPGERDIWVGVAAMGKITPFDIAAYIREQLKAKGYQLEDWWVEDHKGV